VRRISRCRQVDSDVSAMCLVRMPTVVVVVVAVAVAVAAVAAAVVVVVVVVVVVGTGAPTNPKKRILTYCL